MTALAVFGDGGHWAARFLKPGFGHVFVCVLAGRYWIRIDPELGDPMFEVVCGAEHDLAAHYEAQGFAVVTCARKPCMVKLPFMLRNCVGVAKAILGVDSLAITPYQLYKRLSCD